MVLLFCVGYVFNKLHGETFMSDDVKDYSSESDQHYCGVTSQFSKRVNEQNKMQPKYCMPGEAGEGMEGEKRNEQAGP